MPEESSANTNLWESILNASSTAVQHRARTIILLGDRNCGKTSTLEALLAANGPSSSSENYGEIVAVKGLALDYSYLDVKEEGETIARTDVWQLEGDPDHRNLLQFALSDYKALSSTIAVVAVDLSKPWLVQESVERWLNVLKELIKSLHLNAEQLAKAKEAIAVRFRTYVEPGKDAVKKKKAFSVGIDEEHENNKKAGGEEGEDKKKIALRDLPPGALADCLGIPFIIVGLKSDVLAGLEREFSYKEQNFDDLNALLRYYCYRYGGGLIYCSPRDGTNISVLQNYLEHLLYGFDFTTIPSILERDSVFVPIGWDSLAQILATSHSLKQENEENAIDLKLTNILPVPASISSASSNAEETKSETNQNLTVSEDEQTFLEKHKSNIEKKDQIKQKAADAGSISSPNLSSPAMKRTADTPSAANTPTNLNLPQTPVAGNFASPANSPAVKEEKKQEQDRAAIESFFNRLITSDSRKKK